MRRGKGRLLLNVLELFCILTVVVVICVKSHTTVATRVNFILCKLRKAALAAISLMAVNDRGLAAPVKGCSLFQP